MSEKPTNYDPLSEELKQNAVTPRTIDAIARGLAEKVRRGG